MSTPKRIHPRTAIRIHLGTPDRIHGPDDVGTMMSKMSTRVVFLSTVEAGEFREDAAAWKRIMRWALDAYDVVQEAGGPLPWSSSRTAG